jgi:cytochrome c oxidase cbb3-type subunit 2
MPPYVFLADQDLDARAIRAQLRTMRTVGVPYTADQIANAEADLAAQVDPFASETSALRLRYGPKVAQGDFDGDPARLTKMDALIAYLQQLGTMVDFRTYQAEDPDNMR